MKYKIKKQIKFKMIILRISPKRQEGENMAIITNSASLTFNNERTASSNEVDTEVRESQSVAIVKDALLTNYVPGEPVGYVITVTNTGTRDGDEIVQLYIHDKVASISRPVRELKGFKRIHLDAGESKDVSFDITPDLLKFYDANLKEVLEPGQFDLMIGASSINNKTTLFTVY